MIDPAEYHFEKLKLFIKDEAEKPSGFKILTIETAPQAFNMGYKEGQIDLAKKLKIKIEQMEWDSGDR